MSVESESESEFNFEIRFSKILLACLILSQSLAFFSLFYLMAHNINYVIFLIIYITFQFFYIKKWIEQYKINPVVQIKKLDIKSSSKCDEISSISSIFSISSRSDGVPVFWEMTFKNGTRQKIQLVRYYRSVFLLILSYKVIRKYGRLSGKLAADKLCFLVIPYDAVSKTDYGNISRLLWSG